MGGGEGGVGGDCDGGGIGTGDVGLSLLFLGGFGVLRLGAEVDDGAQAIVGVEPVAVGGRGFVWAGGAVKEAFAEQAAGLMRVDGGGDVAEVEEGLEAAVVELVAASLGPRGGGHLVYETWQCRT